MSMKAEAQYRIAERSGSCKPKVSTQAVRSVVPSIPQRAMVTPGSLTAADFMQMQRTAGNRIVQRMIAGVTGLSSATIQREPLKEEDEKKLQMKRMDGAGVLPLQRAVEEEDESAQLKAAQSIQRETSPEPVSSPRENHTGMSDTLKAGLENLSGLDLSAVRVHHNSDKPAQVGALAYTQGSNIYVAPGQERHLPHEGWHAIQQMQGRVQSIGEVAGLPLNDDTVLEREADRMGEQAARMKWN